MTLSDNKQFAYQFFAEKYYFSFYKCFSLTENQELYFHNSGNSYKIDEEIYKYKI